MSLQVSLFWLINLLREDTLTLFISTFAVGEAESKYLFGILSIVALFLATIKYSRIPQNRRTVWHFCVDVEQTRESKVYKILGCSCVLISSLVACMSWIKEFGTEDLMETLTNIFSLLLNAYQIMSIYTYDGPCHQDVGEYLRLGKVQLPKWIGSVRCFWCDSEGLLTSLHLIALAKTSNHKVSLEKLKQSDEFGYLPWETVEHLNRGDLVVLAEAFKNRKRQKRFVLKKRHEAHTKSS